MNGEQNKDHHLNLFYFYGQSGKQFIENNLTRGLAICLENDPIFFDRFLRKILKSEYEKLFSVEGQNMEIVIAVQKESKNFVGIQEIIGIPLTAKDLSGKFNDEGDGAENPTTDLSIQINDKLILVEVKKHKADCRRQLQNQIDVVCESNESIPESRIFDERFDWSNLMDLCRQTLKFEREVSQTNLFTDDYYNFVKQQFPSWFENLPFSKIDFPDDLDSNPKLKEHLEVRINVIKKRMLEIRNEKKGTKDELVHSRENIPVQDYSWVDEINVEPVVDKETGEKFIALKIWPGDTKTQGYPIFKKGRKFEWPKSFHKEEYEFVCHPYLKFSHMKSLCWVWTKDNVNPITHTHEFFYNYTGKWNRDKSKKWKKGKVNWEDFDKTIEKVNKAKEDWKTASGFNGKIESSERSYFNVSAGFAIEIRIPYHIAEQKDGSMGKGADIMAHELYILSAELLKVLNDQFTNN